MRGSSPTARQPALGWLLAAIGGACGIAVAQPLYDVVGHAPAFFVAHQADGWDVALLCLALSIALPLALALPAVLVHRLHTGLGRTLAMAALALCGAALGAGIARRADLGATLAVAFTLTAGAATAWLARSPRGLRALGLLGVGVLVFPALLLARAEVRALFPDRGDEPAAARSDLARTPPVVLVVFDELPLVSLLDAERGIDAGRFPNFARLAATATWYSEATTVAQSTVYSVPSILSGRYPIEHKQMAPTARSYRYNLFTILGSDFAFNDWESSTHLCPQRLCKPPEMWTIARRRRLPAMLLDLSAIFAHQIVPRAWSAGLPPVDDQWRDFWGPRAGPGGELPNELSERTGRPADVFAWFLNSLRPAGAKPAVHFAHVMLPHQPWRWLPDGRAYEVRDRSPHGLVHQQWQGSEWEVTQAQQRHLLTLGFVDTLLGDLLRTLERRELLDDALLVVTADHGGTFLRGTQRRNLGSQALDPIVSVPLFVKFPHQRAGVVDARNAELIDILPTILEVLGVRAPRPIDGVSLRAPAEVKGEAKRTYRTGTADMGSGGRPVVYALGETASRHEAAALQRERFGYGSWDSVFAIGPRPELHGAAVAHLPTAQAPAGARIVGLERFAAIDPDADPLPLQVAGDLEGSRGAPPAVLAVALDGTIRCTTESYATESGTQAFTALLPPNALRRGANRLEVFRVAGLPAAPTLERLALAPQNGGSR